ncbi:MAG TPA: NmrA family NAD(P)-binding protein [Nitrososphaeraceae archaeon]|nr:NmrA family NAD(P)-binding protein [Nitrososphaeraceae archaeon]
MVTGATGQQGGSLARLLLQKKHKVYALTRNAQSSSAQDLRNRGANIVKGDLDDSDSLEHAIKDVESVFLMGTPFEDGTEGEIRRGKLVYLPLKAGNIILLICNQNFLSFKFTLSGFTIRWKAIPSDNARKPLLSLNLLRIEFCYAVPLRPLMVFNITRSFLNADLEFVSNHYRVCWHTHIKNRKA